jgi:uncharacterized protein YqgC (DUF456 family)
MERIFVFLIVPTILAGMVTGPTTPGIPSTAEQKYAFAHYGWQTALQDFALAWPVCLVVTIVVYFPIKRMCKTFFDGPHHRGSKPPNDW